MGDCSTCTERQGYYLDAETIANQQEHIAELENAYNLLQSQFDITRERWMKRGEYIAKQRERMEELESLVRDIYESLWTVSESWAYDAYHERMAALGLTEVNR